MPFTFSHPAIVFPLRWLLPSWTSLTGLVAGSVVPDFEKFLKMGPQNTFSHTWHGIFWFNLPLGIILCFVFHQLVRNPLIEHLPEFLRKRLYSFKSFDWQAHFKTHFGIVAFSVVLGAVSHIVWDDVTHWYGKAVQFLPFLSRPVNLHNYIRIPLWAFLDMVSSIGGIFFILTVIMSLPAVIVPKRDPFKKVKYWSLCLLIFVLVVSLRFVKSLGSYAFWEPVLSTDKGSEEFWEMVFTSVSAALISLLISSVIYRYRQA